MDAAYWVPVNGRHGNTTEQFNPTWYLPTWRPTTVHLNAAVLPQHYDRLIAQKRDGQTACSDGTRLSDLRHNLYVKINTSPSLLSPSTRGVHFKILDTLTHSFLTLPLQHMFRLLPHLLRDVQQSAVLTQAACINWAYNSMFKTEFTSDKKLLELWSSALIPCSAVDV
jgi:hypothetical protein